MMSPEEVVDRFLRGDMGSGGTIASIRVRDNQHVLVGYSYAIYAVRRANGTVVRFNGWSGSSKTTNRHLNQLDGHVDFERDVAPVTSERLVIDGSWEGDR